MALLEVPDEVFKKYLAAQVDISTAWKKFHDGDINFAEVDEAQADFNEVAAELLESLKVLE